LCGKRELTLGYQPEAPFLGHNLQNVPLEIARIVSQCNNAMPDVLAYNE
jgi:hypothetical protein